MSENPYANPETTEPAPVQKTSTKQRLVELLVVIAIIFVLLGLLLPATRSARPAAYRMQCGNNLKQIALALNSYKDTYGSFPPAFTTDADGKPLHSWRTLILPYMEQQALYETIDLTKPWNDPVNKPASEQKIETFGCPSSYDTIEHKTTYLALLDDDSRLSESGVCIVEVSESMAVPWMQPTDVDRKTISRYFAGDEFSHYGGFNLAQADGSIRFYSKDNQSEFFSPQQETPQSP